MKLSIILPAYNEGNHVVRVIEEALAARSKIVEQTKLKAVEVVIVNDGSFDNTKANIEALLAKRPGEFVFANHPENRGYGAALKTGFDAASGDYLSFMDADGTIDPLSFIPLFNKLHDSSADMALGIRFGAGESKMPFVRKMGNYFFAALLSFLSGERVKDTATGIRLFHRDVLKKLYPLPDGLHFTPAMSSKAVHEKIKTVDIPISYDQREGKSKLSVVKDGYRFLRIILGTVLLYNPFKVFFSVGMIFVLFSLALLLKPILVLFTPEDLVFTDYIYRSIGAMYFFVSGVLVILFGILARFLVSTFFKMHESGEWIHKFNDWIRIYDRMTPYGFLVFLMGVAVNVLYFMHYIVEKTLRFHWAWLLLAAGFIIIGIQMMITGIVIKVVKKIKQTIDYH